MRMQLASLALVLFELLKELFVIRNRVAESSNGYLGSVSISDR